MNDLNSFLVEKFKNKHFEKLFHREEAFSRLADEILLLRKKREMSQKELAEKVGTTQAVVSRLENATVKPSVETIIKFAEALDAAVDIRLIPFEEIRQDTVGVQENAYQKRQDILKGISYFAIEQAKEGMEHSINPEKIASPVWSVSVNSKRTVVKKKKVIEFA